MVRYWENYRVEGLDPDDPMVSPLRARDFRGLPPALIHTAEYDPLCDEGALYAIELARAGVRGPSLPASRHDPSFLRPWRRHSLRRDRLGGDRRGNSRGVRLSGGRNPGRDYGGELPEA